MDLTAAHLLGFAEEVGSEGPVTVAGFGTRGGAVPGVRTVTAPAGIRWVQADEMTVCCGAATPVDDVRAALAEVGQRVALPDGGTVGGALAVGRSGVRRLGDGPVRDTLLQAVYVSADGQLVQVGGPTVKNVSGFDLCRLLVGSRGTLGFIAEVVLRTKPLPAHSQWFRIATDAPDAVAAALFRPTSVLWDGTALWALLEGHPDDVAEAARVHGLLPADPPSLPAGHTLVAPRQVGELRGRFVAEWGVGVVHGECSLVPEVPPPPAALTQRLREQFDPRGRLNPGVDVG
jgi:glycolate oxidase FAD binding subunit